MQPMTNGTVKLFFVSGIVLPILCFFLIFLIGIVAAMGVDSSNWGVFIYQLAWVVSGIAIYYLSIALFGWMLLRRKKPSVS